MRADSYETLDPGGGRAMVRPESRQLLKEVDAVVFDCDGTLIDVRRSYDATIMRTVRTMVEEFSGVSLPMEDVGGELILKIRRTGGFNSDWDTAYALSLLSEVAIEQRPSKVGAGLDHILDRLGELVADFSSRNRLAGRRSIDRYLDRAGLASDGLKEFQRFLGYPGNAMQSKMAETFDQIYYGGRLFREIYGVMPAVWYDQGLIERETLFFSRDDVVRFKKIIGGKKMAIVTGRSFVAVRHTMGRLLQHFERDASVYIGDGDVHPELASELVKYRKPSGASLIRAIEKLSAKVLLYIGDSAEDRLMVDDARKRYGNILFAGIYGSSFNERAQISYFGGTGSDLLVKSLSQVPSVLEMIRK
ncbi:MAG: HAD family hydrolase [Nitrososphaerales archaeon]